MNEEPNRRTLVNCLRMMADLIESGAAVPLPTPNQLSLKYSDSNGRKLQQFHCDLRFVHDHEREQHVAEAVAALNRKWDDSLTSGVMFWKGTRITRAEFEAGCRK